MNYGKNLIVITILLGALLSIGLADGFIVVAFNGSDDGICFTKECNDTSSRVLSQLDTSVEP